MSSIRLNLIFEVVFLSKVELEIIFEIIKTPFVENEFWKSLSIFIIDMTAKEMSNSNSSLVTNRDMEFLFT
jgi:hypothetical protein